MARQVIATAILMLLAGAGAAAAAVRLAVLEFFGRPNGAYCSAAGPAMRDLQEEYAGRAVLLEYDYDRFVLGRVDRFRATGVTANFLPLVMVGSGYRTSSGQVAYESVYRGMIEDELARPAEASIDAAWRRSGNAVRAYVRVVNTGADTLRRTREAALWVIAYEESTLGVSQTWVRATAQWPLPSDLEPGEAVDAVVDLPITAAVNWSRMNALALLEFRTSSSGRYDMLQAAAAVPAAITASPRQALVHPARPQAEIRLDGPHVLEWTATTDVPWLAVAPAAGGLPATVTVTLVDSLRPAGATTATLTVQAAGDSMDLEVTVPVTVGAPVRRPAGRVRPDG